MADDDENQYDESGATHVVGPGPDYKAGFGGRRDAGRRTDSDASCVPERAPKDEAVSDNVIRFMRDYTVLVPLWGHGCLLSRDPEWLRGVLGLSASLVEALTAWGADMNAADKTPWSQRTREDWEQTYRVLDARARELVEWLRRELHPRYQVVYKPW